LSLRCSITWSASSGDGRVRPQKRARGLEDLIRPPQLRHFFAELLQLLALDARQSVVALAGVRLRLADPAAQGFLVDAQVLGDVRDRPAGGADFTDGPLAEQNLCCGQPPP
jgi:hypothetical protein